MPSISEQDKLSATWVSAVGVATYVREDIPMKELRKLESSEHQAEWVWCKPSAMPRAYSCIIFASILLPWKC